MKIKRSLITATAAFGFQIEDEFCSTVIIWVGEDDENDIPEGALPECGRVYWIYLGGFSPVMASPVMDQIEEFNKRPWIARTNIFEALREAKTIAENLVKILTEQPSPSDEEKDGIF